jgi:excisionase family DNA binding protein
MNTHKQHLHAEERTGLLDAHEASRLLGLSFWTLYTWARKGRISYIQLGKRKLFDQKDIEEFINRHRIKEATYDKD